MYRARLPHFITAVMVLIAMLATAAPSQKGKKKKPPPPPSIDAAITYTRPGFPGDIWVASPDGSQTARLLKFRQGGAVNPCFSPDGTKIAFAARFKNNQPVKLCTINANGTGLRELCVLRNIYYWAIQVDWSPDGTKIAFNDRALTGGLDDIFTIHPDGSGLTNLTNTLAWSEEQPSWSPTGSRLVVRRSGSATPNNLVVLQLDAGGQLAAVQDITNLPGSPLRDRVYWASRSCAWARNGESIAAVISDVPWGNVTDIWLIDLANPQGPMNLTNTLENPNEVHPAFDDVDQRIFFNVIGQNSTWRGIWVMEIDGSNRVLFITHDTDISWGLNHRR